MPTLSKYKNLLIAVVSFCVLYLAYVYVWPYFGISNEVGLEQTASNPVALKNADLVSRLTNAKGIRFDVSFFTEDEFVNLKDYTKEINATSEPMSRANPFAPIGQ
jgi:hypothetical protein